MKTADRKTKVNSKKACSCCCEGLKFEAISSCTKCGNPIFTECCCSQGKCPKVIRSCNCECV